MRFYPARSALRSRCFGVFAAGNLVSQSGEWMTLVALNWQVLEFTDGQLSRVRYFRSHEQALELAASLDGTFADA